MERRAPRSSSLGQPLAKTSDKKKKPGTFVLLLVAVNAVIMAGFMFHVFFPKPRGSVAKTSFPFSAPALRGAAVAPPPAASSPSKVEAPAATYHCEPPCRALSNGVEMPVLLYGTAWKKERTEALVKLALRNGFRGVDSANQGRHYNEAGTGAAVAASIAQGKVVRGELFLQSKYTFPRGHQAGQEPYDPHAPISEQVNQSFENTLRKFGTAYLDSYVLHGPLAKGRLSSEDVEVWKTLELLYQAGRVRAIGVSNFDAGQLAKLLAVATVRPHVAQVRTFASTGWDDRDGGVKALCQQHGIAYQAYSLLTANRAALSSPPVQALAAARKETAQQLAFRFALGTEGMVALTGTTDDAHMAQDLFVAKTLAAAPLAEAEASALRTAGQAAVSPEGGLGRKGRRPPPRAQGGR